jgi:tRNA threonylcarbamoyladenosine biosynthesis protein TsaB
VEKAFVSAPRSIADEHIRPRTIVQYNPIMSVLILALDTSHQPGSVAIANGRELRAEVVLAEQLPHPGSTAQSFAVRIRDMLRSIDARPADVGLVAVDVGPGSFTGLRIAVTFAKTFAYATGATVLGITSMDVLAHQAAASRSAPIGRLWTLVDAHRGQLFVAQYAIGEGVEADRRIATQEPRMVDFERWLCELAHRDVVTGPVVDRIGARLPAGVDVIDAQARVPAAQTVAQVAWQRWQAGQRDDLWQLRPFYIRQSAAEERRRATGAGCVSGDAPTCGESGAKE